MPRPGNYAEQAKTYDLTRGASPTVVRAVARYLGPAQGRSLLDIAGGTGNYAQAFEARGFRVTVLDASPDMLAHAARKLGPGRSVACDAQALPFREGRFDGATMINAIHLLEDPSQALREARRILRGGPLVLTAFTRENMALFVFDYFDLEAPAARRIPEEEIEAMLRDAGFERVEHEAYVYTDTVDGSLNALHTNALHLAGPAYLRNTSFWHALDEETRRKGLDALARDLRSGVLERKVEDSVRTAVPSGHGTAFAAWPSV
jgi:demethylmenaquinone methyltransferase/2-methoxy-6-polyprenyl-1,4-benzoquinol methylase